MLFKKKKKSKILWLFLLLIPVLAIIIASINNDESETETPIKIVWSSLELNSFLPEPELSLGLINSNSNQRLDVDLVDATQDQYKTYLGKCIALGYTIDKTESTNEYTAYNEDGYFLEIYFSENNEKLCINLDCPEIFGDLLWSNSEMAQLLPIPNSNKGNIITDSKERLYVKVADISIDEYKNYIKDCSDKGFNLEVSNTEKRYSAINCDKFKLTVEYTGFNTITITMLEPEYTVDIEIECVKNLVFSTYDVQVFFNDTYKKLVTHGSSENLTFNLTRDTYTLKFVSLEDNELTGTVSFKVTKDEKFKYKLSCSSFGISVETLEGTIITEESSTEELTTKAEESTTTETILSEYDIAFERANTQYSLYYMFDFDTKTVVYFSSDDTAVEKGTYSGDFATGVTIQWEHGEYSNKFIHKDNSSIATLIDANGFDWTYDICSVTRAQKRLNILRPEEAPTSAEEMEPTDDWDGIKLTVNDISMSGQCEFNHIDGEIMRLGNNEHGTITLTIDNPNATEDDIIILYDDTIIDLTTESPAHTNSSTTISATITGKTEGTCDIEIYTKYDIATKGEDAYGLVLPVRKYNNTDGRIVYITPSGKKFHFSKSCAGENANSTTYTEAKSYEYSACGNCS